MPSDKPIRLQAWLSKAGVASRRKAEELILAGRVTVNDRIVQELGTKVALGDHVYLDGTELQLEDSLVYVVLNKPRGYIASLSDPQGRPLAADLLKPTLTQRVYNVGRLDQWSAGLILFTNDGDFAARLGHPSSGIEKEYEIVTDLDIPDTLIREFPRGIEIGGIVYQAQRARKLGPRKARIVLIEGKNREIRRVFSAYQLRALSLVRVRIGPILLGDLAEGEFRALSPNELEVLRQSTGVDS